MGGERMYVPNAHISAKLQLHQSTVRAYRYGAAEKWIMLEEWFSDKF